MKGYVLPLSCNVEMTRWSIPENSIESKWYQVVISNFGMLNISL